MFNVRGRCASACALLFLSLCSLSVIAQNDDRNDVPVQRNPTVSQPSYPKLIDVDLRDLPVKEAWRAGDAIKEIPRRRTRKVEDKEKPESRRDSLLDLQESALDGFSDVSPLLNFNGQGYSGVNPPDTVGDVGLNYFIQSINGGGGATYVIYSKADGSVVAGPFSMESLGSGSCASGLGDPVVLYDELAQRWMISEFSNAANVLCVYVSQTSDPISGGWYNYVFNTPNFPDYPKYGVWPDGYYVGTNENISRLYALDRLSMLNGDPATAQSFSATDLSGFSFQMVTPADLDGSTAPPPGAPNVFMRHRDDEIHAGSSNGSEDYLELFEFSVDWGTPANSSLTGPISIAVSEFDSTLCGTSSFSCFPQPGTSTQLDPLREVVMFRLSYRNFGAYQVLLGNLVTDVDGSDHGGVRWFELRNSGGSWSVFQEGTYAPDSDNRWMAGIAMDGSGNIAVAYNVSSSSTFPGLRYAGRLASDPLGTLPQGEYTIVNGSASNNSNRYGDYASMGVDPADGCTFWFTGQYNNAGSWSTRIATFSFDECGCTNPPAAPSSLGAVNNGLNQVDLSWNAVAGATEYRVFRAQGSCPQPSYSLIGTTSSISFSDTSVSGGTPYAYVVTAFDGVEGCESGNSSCVDITPLGNCAQAPNFSGLQSVSNDMSSSCSLTLSWVAGTPNCGSSVSYNIYRSTTSGFTPNAGNRIQSCVVGTSYSDSDVSGATPYYYIVRAEDNSGGGSGPCGGNEDTNTIELQGVASGPDTVFLNDDMESGSGNWATAALPADTGRSAWSIATSQSQSGTHAWFCSDESSVKDQVVETVTPIAIPAFVSGTLQFESYYNTESTYDGGVLEYSTNGGSSWQDILAGDGGSVAANSGRILTNGYNSTISTSYSSPIGGRSAWSGNSGGFLLTQVDLTDLAGNTVLFRWRMACDSSVAATGWWLDDVVVSYGSDCTTGSCSYAIDPTSAAFGASGGSDSVTVTAASGCTWSASSNVGWVSITSGSSGNGNGAVAYTVAANTSSSSRAGSMTIAGQSFTVNQAGMACSYSISPSSASFTDSGGSGSVTVSAASGCAWTAASNDGWISISSGSSGSGNGTVGYSVAANGSSSARAGSMTIAGQTFTVNQDGGACSYAISPTSASYGDAGGSGSVSVTADSGCAWVASSNAAWITVTSGSSGSGSGTVGYSVAANGSISSRAGTLTIAGQTFTVNQAGVPCSYGVSPTSAAFGEAGGSASFAVTAAAGCAWTAGSNDAWISITSGASGSGNGSVGYAVAANGTTSARSGSMTIAGQTVTVTQDAGSTGSWVELTNDDFESGWGSYVDGGSDCRRSARDAAYAHQGTYCVRIRDNSGSASSFYSQNSLNISSYSELQIEFWYRPVSMETNENFFVELWDGTQWNVIANYVAGTDFTNNNFYNPTIVVDSGSVNFASNAQLRFRCDASGNNDRVYIDEIVVSGR